MPKPDPASQRGKAMQAAIAAGTAPAPVSRLDGFKRARSDPPMPPNPAPHLTSWLVEIGLTEAAGMGAAPLSWGEINEWCRAASIRLAPWERRLMRRMSVEYLAESRRAESENCPAPWFRAATPRELQLQQARLEALLG